VTITSEPPKNIKQRIGENTPRHRFYGGGGAKGIQTNAENRPHPMLARASNGSETRAAEAACNLAAIAGDNAGWTRAKTARGKLLRAFSLPVVARRY
jgi:hypothetical protein